MIGLALSLSPALLFLLTAIGYGNPNIYVLSMLLWFAETVLIFSGWGVILCAAGLVICVIALCRGKKRIGKRGFTLSIIAILWSLFWISGMFYIGWLMNMGRFP